jgi:hypothetical protein
MDVLVKRLRHLFTLSLSNPNILEFASPTTANASLNSKYSTSLKAIPALSSALGRAFDGLVVNHWLLCSIGVTFDKG